jgi:hypothetical protein
VTAAIEVSSPSIWALPVLGEASASVCHSKYVFSAFAFPGHVGERAVGRADIGDEILQVLAYADGGVGGEGICWNGHGYLPSIRRAKASAC